MGKEILTFDNIEIGQKRFYHNKTHIFFFFLFFFFLLLFFSFLFFGGRDEGIEKVLVSRKIDFFW